MITYKHKEENIFIFNEDIHEAFTTSKEYLVDFAKNQGIEGSVSTYLIANEYVHLTILSHREVTRDEINFFIEEICKESMFELGSNYEDDLFTVMFY